MKNVNDFYQIEYNENQNPTFAIDKQQLYTVKFTRHVCVLWSVFVFSFFVCLMLSIDLDISFDIH